MGKIDELINKKKAESAIFATEYEKEAQRLDIAIALTQLRKELGLTQRELAEKVGKPQSTIARIENGSMNPSLTILHEIATKVGKELHVEFK
ncbi:MULTISPECIES: helix-turn-helix domain-containing protein [Enterococcus]|uniref:Helix-turn-helix transcriptional regulator n=1 Tax=Candidatus Enterococcus murrayae TaxID=2815321 RepID=A0ABS3HEK9_9ENTE|nr:helix-turn-helix transcriptional regulator [Enterococcus sp. MJM16]MBO0451895.1 helix-turn-helix transcriptional regulator [Enterococcus sp. MJM16]